jgi:hypothetical protein
MHYFMYCILDTGGLFIGLGCPQITPQNSFAPLPYQPGPVGVTG